MKILMLLETSFPHDDRVEKEIRTLQNNHHEVVLACSTRTSEKETDHYKGIQIFRLHLNRFWYKLSALVLVLPFYHRKWRKYIEQVYREYPFEAIHIHDLPLARIGMFFKKKYGIKLVLDQHEYYSNWIVETAHYNTLPGKIVSVFSNWKKYEKKSLLQADLVITVEPPLQSQYINEYGLNSGNIIVLPNTPEKTVFHQGNVDRKRYLKYKDHFTLLYFGGLDILRGIDNVIQAIPAIVEEIPEFKFVLAGKKYGGYDPLRSASKYQVESYVDFLGWVDLQEIPSLIEAVDMGIFIPPSERREINLTIATKNYQFRVMQKPMIVGKAAYMKEFTEKNMIGISVDENDTAEIAQSVISIYKDKVMLDKLSQRCREVGPSYYWEITSKSLISGYEDI